MENLGREKGENKKNKTDNQNDPKNTDHTCHRAFSFADTKTQTVALNIFTTADLSSLKLN